MTTWISSDIHLWHHNILVYCADTRNYEDVVEMNVAIMDDIIAKFKQGDELILLGDICFGSKEKVETALRFLANLPGRVRVILGNHDRFRKDIYKKIADEFANFSFTEYAEQHFLVDGKKVHTIMMHYPIHSWHNMHHGSVHLHGHTHGSIPEVGRRIDAGWDRWGSVQDISDVLRYALTKEISVNDGDHHH